MRGNVVFDECGFLSDEMMSVYAAFAIVNKSFKSGKDRDGNSIDEIRLRTIPSEIPNQLFYISSASSTETKFYELYRDFSKRMLAGDRNYFVAHITCDVPLRPTINGKVMAPLFEKSIIDSDMRTNPEKARREYYCKFTTDAGENAIIRRGLITKNSETRLPELFNPDGKKKYVLCYDPARKKDNSVITVAEIYLDEKDKQYKAKIVNCVSLIDVNKKTKTPMQTPEQVEYLKKLILQYDGDTENYDNILGIYIDAGTGGAGVNIADYLMPDWEDELGNIHKGLIDKEYSVEYKSKFPNAVNKVHLLEPTKYKSEMYEALIEMMNQNAISFTAPYDNKGYLTIMDIDETELNKAKSKIEAKLKELELSDEEYMQSFDEELMKYSTVKTRIEKLDRFQEIALTGIDALKEELVNMVRIERTSGKDGFELCVEKRNTMHDDRAYTVAMLGWALQQKRRENLKRKPKTNAKSLIDKLPIKRAKI